MRGDEVILNISISSIPHLSAQCLPNLTLAVKEIWVFISEFLLFPTETKATNPSISSSGVELEFSYVRVISCLEQMGRSCLLMSLRWWVFSHRFPPSALPCMTLWETHHLCVKQLFLSRVMGWIFQKHPVFWQLFHEHATVKLTNLCNLVFAIFYSCLPFSYVYFLVNSLHSVSSWCTGLTI